MKSFIYNKNKIKKESRYDKKSKLFFTTNYIYDDKNNKLIKEQGKVYKFGIGSGFEANYEYDESGKLIKIHQKSTIMGIKSKTSTTQYVYDDNNLLVKEISTLGYFDTVLIYEYDDESKLLKKCSCYMNDVLSYETIYEYDESKIIKKNVYDKDGKQKTYSVFDYDDNNNLIKITTYNMDDSIKEYTIFE